MPAKPYPASLNADFEEADREYEAALAELQTARSNFIQADRKRRDAIRKLYDLQCQPMAAD